MKHFLLISIACLAVPCAGTARAIANNPPPNHGWDPNAGLDVPIIIHQGGPFTVGGFADPTSKERGLNFSDRKVVGFSFSGHAAELELGALPSHLRLRIDRFTFPLGGPIADEQDTEVFSITGDDWAFSEAMDPGSYFHGHLSTPGGGPGGTGTPHFFAEDKQFAAMGLWKFTLDLVPAGDAHPAAFAVWKAVVIILHMAQVPIPAPGALVVLGIAGLIGLRGGRRRTSLAAG